MNDATKKETIAEKDLFSEKLKEFQNSRNADKIREKFRPKTIEEKYKYANLLSIVFTYLCGIISIVTGSSFLYFKILNSLNGFFAAMYISGIITAVILISLEVVLRILSPITVRGLLQFKKVGFIKIGIIAGISVLSVFMSFNGSFETMRITSPPPTLPVANLQSIEDIKQDFDLSIDQAKSEAKDFKNSQQWNGRLSIRNGKIYSDLLSNVNELRNKKNTALNTAKQENKAAIYEANMELLEIQKKYHAEIQKKGGILGYISIICQFVFYICIIGTEIYYFAVLGQYSETVKQEPEQIKAAKSTIGYKQQTEYKQVAQQEKQIKTTIEHNGRYYTEAQVNNLIRTYEKRVEEAHEKQDGNLAQRREQVLIYWFQRKKEFN